LATVTVEYDIHILDATTMRWSAPHIGGRPPSPRAGMTFTQVRDRIFLFGGSGPSAKCFNDLQIFETKSLEWLNITTPEERRASQAAGSGGGNASGKGSNNTNTAPRNNNRGGGGGGGSTDGGSTAAAGGSALDVGGGLFASKYSEMGDAVVGGANGGSGGVSDGADLSGRDAMSSGAGLTASMGISAGGSDVV
jgi:hypothetical protein